MDVTTHASEHFTWREVACKCCQRVKIVERLWIHLDRLEALREKMGGAPLVMASGYRCEAHNHDVGGEPNSQHLVFATDVHAEWGQNTLEWCDEFAAMAEEFGFDGIGRYTFTRKSVTSGLFVSSGLGFVHLDRRGWRARWSRESRLSA